MVLRTRIHLLSPELIFGVFHTAVWLFLLIEVTGGVLGPLADALAAPWPR